MSTPPGSEDLPIGTSWKSTFPVVAEHWGMLAALASVFINHYHQYIVSWA